MLTALSQLNIELTSQCDRATKCGFCGHQSLTVNPNLQYGDMPMKLLWKIREQVTPPITISMHRDGDPLAYPLLFGALKLFTGFPVSVVTHGEALNRRADEIIDNCTSVTVSVIPNDPDRKLQLESMRGFLAKKGDRSPMLQLKCVGNVENIEEYEALGVPITNRPLHHKKGNWTYQTPPKRPEINVCLDFLSRPTIDWRGRMFICNRLDTSDAGMIGDLNEQSLDEIWNGPKRKAMLEHHLKGRRDLANPLCASCNFWGVPS